jgi:hypothetical protein
LWTPSYPHPVDGGDRARASDFYPRNLNALFALIPRQGVRTDVGFVS